MTGKIILIIVAAVALTVVLTSLLISGRMRKKVAYMLDALEDKELNFRFDEKRFIGRKFNKTLNRLRSIFDKERRDIMEQEQYYGLMLDHVKTGIVVTEADGRVNYHNQTALDLLGIATFSNIRQLKNVAEKISALESVKLSSGSDKCIIDAEVLMKYIPREEPNLLPATVQTQEKFEASEKEAIVRMLLQLKQEVDYLKDVLAEAGLTGAASSRHVPAIPQDLSGEAVQYDTRQEDPEEQELEDRTPEDLSLKALGQELIEKVLRKHGGNRKAAAAELGISERTLYRKLKK